MTRREDSGDVDCDSEVWLAEVQHLEEKDNSGVLHHVEYAPRGKETDEARDLDGNALGATVV
jgi:hypothetical protein